MMIEVKGTIIGGRTHITQPKFETKHILFFRKYLGIETISLTPLGTVINKRVGMAKIQTAVKAYEYEFGKW